MQPNQKGTSFKPFAVDHGMKLLFAEGVGMSGALLLRDILLKPSAVAPTPTAAAKSLGAAVAPKPGSRQRRGRPDEVTPPKHRKIRELHDLWRETGWTLEKYARVTLDVSRQNFSNWLRELNHPSAEDRAKIKARTGVDVGPRLPRRR
jgi:hypothetical protein